jgi:paraquat-inducible protein B
MAEPPKPPAGREPTEPDYPEAVAVRRSRWRVQLVWLVPIVAVLIGAWLAVHAILEKGPTITISFTTGEGLEAGKTKIKFKDVDVGVVKSVVLSKDHKNVIATAELSKDTDTMLVDDTRFWVVRPRISGGTVSGLGTLLSGSFIGMDIGVKNAKRRDFVGLETPPVLATGMAGREFVLKSSTMGSLDVGSPIYFRRLQVGQVVSYTLNDDGTGVTLRVFVNAPYDKFVLNDTRFWQASGVDVSLDSSGVKLNTESLVAILIGGLAFETPPPLPYASDTEGMARADVGHPFTLYQTKADAMKPQEHIIDHYVFNFSESVRGLIVGAEIDFRGIVVGEVTAINTHYDPVARKFTIPVQVNFYPERFTARYEMQPKGGRVLGNEERHRVAQLLVDQGLRAQLRTASLLTGARYIAVDFFPNTKKFTVNWSQDPPELPTVPSGLASLQDQITALVTKLNAIPFEGIGQDLRKTLQDASTLVKTLDTQLAPEAKATLVAARDALGSTNRIMQSDSPLQASAADTMRELARTAAAFRTLAEYLERHPEALLRGKPPEDQK